VRKSFLVIRISTTAIIFIWVWARSTFPRYRYDLLIRLAWKRILPAALRLSLLVIRVVAL
jgi:NADH-quinone oxidoreductase subunit H